MKQDDKDFRNEASGEGRGRDPQLRDDSAFQPGASTVSQSDSDDANQQVTRTAVEGAENPTFDAEENADPTFDEVPNKKGLQ